MTSMPEVAAEWQNFVQLTADKLYELLRFRHDLCDSERFLELGCTIPAPCLAGNRKFESASPSSGESTNSRSRCVAEGVAASGMTEDAINYDADAAPHRNHGRCAVSVRL